MEKLMTSILPMVQQMIIGNLVGRKNIPDTSYVTLALRGLSFILLLAGLFLVIYSEYIWLGTFLPLHFSALLTAVTVLAASWAIASASGIFKYQKMIQPSSSPLDIEAILKNLLSCLDEDLEDVIRSNPKLSVALSTLGGFIIGKK